MKSTTELAANDLLPVKNDYVFARLFGRRDHERILVRLLNAILNGKPWIKSPYSRSYRI